MPGHPRQQVLRALRIPALSGGWKASFQEMLDQPGRLAGNAGLTGHWTAGHRSGAVFRSHGRLL